MNPLPLSLALWRPVVALLTTGLVAAGAAAGTVSVAVAANFAQPMQRIAAAFERSTGHRARLSFGSTGKFDAQIRNGAPFDLLLAADDVTPARLEAAGFAVRGTRFVYATGRLALWSGRPGYVDAEGRALKTASFARLAIADPRLAPYGAAALETLRRLGELERLEPRLVRGESVGQAWQFTASGNAELGFVALSQVMEDGRLKSGSMWLVPESMHAPLRQEAALLARGAGNAAAVALAAWLRGPDALAVMSGFGYAAP